MAPFGINLDELKGAAGSTRVLRCRRVRASRGDSTVMAAKLRWQSDAWERAGLGRVPNWIAPMGGALARGCFASLAATVPLSRTLAQACGPRCRRGWIGPDAVQMNADAAAHMGIADGEIVELVSDMGRDRVRVEIDAVSASGVHLHLGRPRRRSFGADAGGAQAFGVGPLDHTPLRWDPLDGRRAHPGKRRSRRKDCRARG